MYMRIHIHTHTTALTLKTFPGVPRGLVDEGRRDEEHCTGVPSVTCFTTEKQEQL